MIPFIVMPDLIRHPFSLAEAVARSEQRRWTPDQVRGDGLESGR